MEVDKSKCLVYFKTIQEKALKCLFEVLKDVLHDVVMTFDHSGVKILTTDGQKCTLVHLKLWADKFEDYYCKRPVPVSFISFLLSRGMTRSMVYTTADSPCPTGRRQHGPASRQCRTRPR